MTFNPAALAAGLQQAFSSVGNAMMQKEAERLAYQRALDKYQYQLQHKYDNPIDRALAEAQIAQLNRAGRGGGGGRARSASPFDMAVVAAQQRLFNTNRVAGNAPVLNKATTNLQKNPMDLLTGKFMDTIRQAQPGINNEAMAYVPTSDEIKAQTAVGKFLEGDQNPLRSFIIRDKFSSPARAQALIEMGQITKDDLLRAEELNILDREDVKAYMNLLNQSEASQAKPQSNGYLY